MKLHWFFLGLCINNCLLLNSFILGSLNGHLFGLCQVVSLVYFSFLGCDGAGSSDLYGQEIVIIQSATIDPITHKPTDARFDSGGLVENMVNSESGLITDSKVPAVKPVSQRSVQVC